VISYILKSKLSVYLNVGRGLIEKSKFKCFIFEFVCWSVRTPTKGKTKENSGVNIHIANITNVPFNGLTKKSNPSLSCFLLSC
jgi:hypothetical protein